MIYIPVDPLETIIANVFLETLGTPLAIGVFAVLFFVILGVVFRLNASAFLIFLLPLIFVFATYGLLPQAVLYAVLMACAFIIYMAAMVVLRR